MDVNETFGRIVSRHRWWLVTSIMLGLLVAALLTWAAGPKYSATGRLQASGVPPSSDTEAAAVSDRIDGIATSAQLLHSAMQSTGLQRSVVDVRRQIAVTRVGSSGVVDVTVTDRNPRVALSLARTLTQHVSDWIDTTPHDIADPLLSDVDNLMKTVTELRSSLPPQSQNQAPALSNTLADLQSERQQLLTDATSMASASVISEPQGVVALSNRAALKLSLGLLLGLVVGLLLAAAHETLRPTVGRARAFARTVDAVLLGRLAPAADLVPPADGVPADLVTALILGARRQAVRTVALTGPLSVVELGKLQQALETALVPPEASPEQMIGSARQNGRVAGAVVPDARVNGAQPAREDGADTAVALRSQETTGAGSVGDAPTVTVLNDALAVQGRRDVGLVAAVPDFASLRSVDDLNNTRRATGWPLIGVIDATCDRRRRMNNNTGRHQGGPR